VATIGVLVLVVCVAGLLAIVALNAVAADAVIAPD